ncbi:MAG: DNA primase, partial [Phycisphaerae bacterium]
AFKGLCPFHHEKTPSFNVRPDRQYFKCFGCGAGGDVFKFVQMKEQVDFVEARAILANRAGISLDDETSAASGREGPGKSDLERVNRWACRWFQKTLTGADGSRVRDYVADRGIRKEAAARFELGFAPTGWTALHDAASRAGIPKALLLAAGLLKQNDDGSCYDAFRNRLIFPIHDVMNRVVGFGGRALDDQPAKYLNSPQSLLFDKSRCLYGLSFAKESLTQSRAVVIVEGYTDCILAHQAGFGQTVATLGTALTVDHCRLLRRYVDSVTLVFDSDEAGMKAADRSLGVFLMEELDVRVAYVREGSDPADLLVSEGKEGFEVVLTSAQDALEFKWNQVRRRYHDAATGPDRRRAVEEFLTLVAQATDRGKRDPISRGLILNQVGKLLALSSAEVERQMRIIARRALPAMSRSEPAPDQRPISPPGAVVAAVKEIVGVLLNDSSFLASVVGELDLEMLPEGDLKDIAGAVLEAARADEALEMAHLLSHFESVRTARLILDLQLAGERRGNYADTIDGAIAHLRLMKEHSEAETMLARHRWGELSSIEEDRTSKETTIEQSKSDVEGAESTLSALSDTARKTNQFAARKHLAALKMAGAEPRGSQGAG